MAQYEMKYMFDWGSGTCVWSTNDAARDKYDYPVNIEELPISSALKEKLDYIIYKHDEALNWDDPAGDLLWSDEEIEQFKTEAKALYLQLKQELGDEYELELWENSLI